MKKTILAFTAVFAAAVMMACTTTTTSPVGATANPIGSRVGEASANSKDSDIDVSISKAAKSAGITKIATVDFRVTSSWTGSTTYTTIVTGTGPGEAATPVDGE